MDETSKTFIKWEKFLRKNPNLTAAYEADPNICAKLLANQEEFEKETILDVAKKNFKKKRKKKK
jgi:hypothetical protein